MATAISQHISGESNFAESAVITYLRRPAILVSALALITLLLYISTLSFQFVWDDHVQVESNPLLLSWKTVPQAFRRSLSFQLSPAGKGNYYRPFFVVWSVFNHSLFGFRPWGWHLTNVLLHVGASCLVFFLLRRMKVEYWTAAIATAAFAVHPVHIEAVAWVSAGADTLTTIFYLLTFLAFLESRDLKNRRRAACMLVSWALFACALLTKEIAVTFPAILAAYLWLDPGGSKHGGMIRRLGKVLVSTLPYALLDVLYLMERARVLHGFSQIQKNYGPLVTLQTLPLVLMDYLRILVFPSGLTGFYYTAYVRKLDVIGFVLPTVVLALVVALVYWWSRREGEPLIAFFGLWIPICLIPVLYLPVFKAGDFIRDRYLYLPSAGLAFLLAKAIRTIPSRSTHGSGGWLQPAAVTVMVGAFSVGVLSQQVYWANDLLLFDRGYTLYPQNAEVMTNLAYALNQRGDPASAMALLQQAIGLDPDDHWSHWELAVVESEFHQDEEARKELSKAVDLAPEYFLGSPRGLTDLGIAFASVHQYSEAENCLRRALEIEPHAGQALVSMGLVLLRTNRSSDAEAYLKKASAVDPEGYNVNWALGMLAQMRGERALAEREFSEEVRLHPENRGARLSLSALSSAR